MTTTTQVVLRALMKNPTERRYGLELCELTGLPTGTIYPILARLEQVDWLESHWEDPETHVSQRRPRRKYYILTQKGVQQAQSILPGSRRSLGWLAAEHGLSGDA